MKKKLSFACPICGRKTEYPLEDLKEGAVLTCPFCKLALTLHGCMWEEVKKEIQHLKEKPKLTALGKRPGKMSS